ncbi:hypothetical protein, partial [Streptomyces sp. NPDC007904]|uniref:hypothetical protein n=1 Tax=Streptomyces sp. NPDC007904 TaxID=3364787 RepID=UPI0036E03449
GTTSDGSPDSASVTLLLVIDASSMIGSYTERFTVPTASEKDCDETGPAAHINGELPVTLPAAPPQEWLA